MCFYAVIFPSCSSQKIDANGDGHVTIAEGQAYLASQGMQGDVNAADRYHFENSSRKTYLDY